MSTSSKAAPRYSSPIIASTRRAVASSSSPSSSKRVEVVISPLPPLPKFYSCEVCYTKTSENLLQSTGLCNHRICKSCVRPYFNGALKDPRYSNYATIECPGHGCKQVFTVNDAFLAKGFNKDEIDGWWSAALEKSFIKNKVRCPMPDCKGIFDAKDEDIKQCIFTECMSCHKGFCMACQKNWHKDEKTSAINEKKAKEIEEAKKTLKHADVSGWSRCPSCSYIVEKREGCRNMICICGVTFCYYCGTRCGYNGACLCNNSVQVSEVRRQMFDSSTIKA